MDSNFFIILGFVLMWLALPCWTFWQEDMDYRSGWHWFKDTMTCLGILILYFASVVCFVIALCADIEADKPIEPFRIEVVQDGTEKPDTTYHYSIFK